MFEKKTLTYKGKVVFEKITMPKFRRIEKYHDENEACFMFLEHTEFSVRTQDEFLRFDHQNALLAKCFNYFFELNKQQWEAAKEMKVIGVVFYPFIIEEIFDLDLAKSNYTSSYNLKQVKVDPLLQHFKESINYLLDNPHLADDTLIILKLREFVQLLLRQENKASILQFFSSLFQPVEYDFKSTIENNIYSNLTLEQFAKLCNMSVSTFKRKFNKVYQTTPKHYFREQKLTKAQSLLLRSDLSITQIAYECGFESISVFNRNFKKFTQLSPTAFRKQRT